MKGMQIYGFTIFTFSPVLLGLYNVIMLSCVRYGLRYCYIQMKKGREFTAVSEIFKAVRKPYVAIPTVLNRNVLKNVCGIFFKLPRQKMCFLLVGFFKINLMTTLLLYCCFDLYV